MRAGFAKAFNTCCLKKLLSPPIGIITSSTIFNNNKINPKGYVKNHKKYIFSHMFIIYNDFQQIHNDPQN